MSRFRCSAGHLVQLAFGDEHVRLPCPTCSVDVYKFRDVVMEDEASVGAPPDASVLSSRTGLTLRAKHVCAAVGAVVLLVGAAYFALHRPGASPAAGSQGPVIPIPAAPKTAPADPSAVSISNFNAAPTDSGAVKVSFRLTNAGGASNDYPGLAVHWHGVRDADQLIGKDSYAHPPLPFTTTDVVLELARPQGATGIDVKITY
jgi:hypothetical protein